MKNLSAIVLAICMLTAITAQGQLFTESESSIFRAAPCNQSYFNVDLSDFQFKPDEDSPKMKNLKPFMLLRMTIGDNEYLRLMQPEYLEYDKTSISIDLELPLWGPFLYIGEPIQLEMKLYGYSGESLDRTIVFIGEMFEPDANQPVNSHHFSDIAEEKLEAMFEAGVQGDEIVHLQTLTTTWVREASYTSFLDFNVAQDGYFAASSQLKAPARPENDERYNAYATIEEVPEEDKGDTYAIYHLTHKGERPDLRAFGDYYEKFRVSQEAAYDGDSVRMEHFFSLAVHYIYANNNFSYEDKVRYHRTEYAHLVDILRNTIPDYKGGELPPKPCR